MAESLGDSRRLCWRFVSSLRLILVDKPSSSLNPQDSSQSITFAGKARGLSLFPSLFLFSEQEDASRSGGGRAPPVLPEAPGRPGQAVSRGDAWW